MRAEAQLTVLRGAHDEDIPARSSRRDGMIAWGCMAKPTRTQAELIALLNAALRRTDVCDGVTVAAIHQVEDKTANWDADALRGSGVPVLPDCKRVFRDAKHGLRKMYDLRVVD